MAGIISEEARIVLKAIADGLSYEQIVAGGFTPNYKALFASIEEAAPFFEKEDRLAKRRAKNPRVGQPWDLDEDDRLRGLLDEGVSISAIAHELGRSEFAVERRKAKLGY